MSEDDPQKNILAWAARTYGNKPKIDRAKWAYYIKKIHPRMSISLILATIGISEGYYRQLRIIHKNEWELQWLSYQQRDITADRIQKPKNSFASSSHDKSRNERLRKLELYRQTLK